MAKNIYIRLSNPISDKYSKFNKACCQNISQPSWSNYKKELRIDFLNEYDCITLYDINCSKKNIIKILSTYFKTIEFYEPNETI